MTEKNTQIDNAIALIAFFLIPVIFFMGLNELQLFRYTFDAYMIALALAVCTLIWLRYGKQRVSANITLSPSLNLQQIAVLAGDSHLRDVEVIEALQSDVIRLAGIRPGLILTCGETPPKQYQQELVSTVKRDRLLVDVNFELEYLEDKHRELVHELRRLGLLHSHIRMELQAIACGTICILVFVLGWMVIFAEGQNLSSEESVTVSSTMIGVFFVFICFGFIRRFRTGAGDKLLSVLKAEWRGSHADANVNYHMLFGVALFGLKSLKKTEFEQYARAIREDNLII